MSCGDEYPDNEEEEKEVAVVCPEWGGGGTQSLRGLSDL